MTGAEGEYAKVTTCPPWQEEINLVVTKLTHRAREKMAGILQITFSNTFPYNMLLVCLNISSHGTDHAEQMGPSLLWGKCLDYQHHLAIEKI